MDRNEKLLKWIRSQKWLLPSGVAMLILLAAVGMALCFISGFERLEPDWIYNIGVDVLGMTICAVLYYGCMSGKDSQEETTYLFVAMLSTNGFALFLDECAWLVQGVPELQMWNRIINVLFYANGVLLVYQFWRYVRVSLRFSGRLMQWASYAVQILFVPATLACWVNLFAPLYFSVDGLGVYRREALYLFSYLYALFCIVVMALGLHGSDAPKRQKYIVVSFVAIPLANAILTANTFGISTQYIATLVSIVLIYSVLFADRSKSLASTETELAMASGIQAHMLPNIFPPFPEREEFDLYAVMDPAKEVGGDFYDFFMIDGDHLALVVADVSGKGVPAALFSMIAKTMLKMQAQTHCDPERVLSEVNASLSEGNEEDMFVTVWLGVLQISTGDLTYADAGHERLLLRQDGRWRFLPKNGGAALAVFTPEDLKYMDEKYRFRNQTIHLNPGDAIFQYTDGVTEASNEANELFGDERLLAAVVGAPSAGPEDLLLGVREKLDEFVKDAPQFDDITMLALQMRKAAGE